MQVFKAYFLIIKRNLAGTLVYFGAFLAISILVSMMSPARQASKNFEETSLRIAIVNQDEASLLTKQIDDLLMANNTFVTVEPNEDAIKDALFFRQIDYAIVIPEGFTTSYLSNEAKDIVSYRDPGSYVSVFVDMKLNQFLSTLQLYNNYSVNDLQHNIANVMQSLDKDTEVRMDAIDIPSPTTGMDFFASYSSYIILAAILYCVTTFMLLFNDSLMRKRTDCSPVRPIVVDGQIILGNIVLAIAAVGILVITAIVLYQGDAWSQKSILYYALMFVYSLMCIGLAFFLSNFAKTKIILSAMVTTTSLGFAFLGGTFIPLSMLGDSVKLVGSFTPAFWFSLACEYLIGTGNYTMTNLGPYWQSLGMIALFGIAFLAMGILIRRTRRLKWM